MFDQIDVVIPVHNEAESLQTLYRRIRDIPLRLNPIFVDNASTDSTLQILEAFKDVTVIKHNKNEGYGASICDGIKKSRADIVVIIDADCEYPPECIPELVKKLDNAQVVYASRFLEKTRMNISWMKRLGNRIVSKTFNVLYGQSITDLYTGCKALRRSALEGICLKRSGFEHVLEMAVKLSQKGLTIHEIPIRFTNRQTGHSKMKHLSETAKFLCLLVYYRFLTK